MAKAKNKKAVKSHLTEEDKRIGKTHIYILIGMIIIGLAIGLYYMQ